MQKFPGVQAGSLYLHIVSVVRAGSAAVFLLLPMTMEEKSLEEIREELHEAENPYGPVKVTMPEDVMLKSTCAEFVADIVCVVLFLIGLFKGTLWCLLPLCVALGLFIWGCVRMGRIRKRLAAERADKLRKMQADFAEEEAYYEKQREVRMACGFPTAVNTLYCMPTYKAFDLRADVDIFAGVGKIFIDGVLRNFSDLLAFRFREEVELADGATVCAARADNVSARPLVASLGVLGHENKGVFLAAARAECKDVAVDEDNVTARHFFVEVTLGGDGSPVVRYDLSDDAVTADELCSRLLLVMAPGNPVPATPDTEEGKH